MTRGAYRAALGLILAGTIGCHARHVDPVRTPGDADPPRAVLRWTARGESGIYGYLIYRADDPHGPFRRINGEIVHADLAAGDEAVSYRYDDENVEPGRTYHYYLETVGNDGRKRRFSGVVAKTVDAP